MTRAVRIWPMAALLLAAMPCGATPPQAALPAPPEVVQQALPTPPVLGRLFATPEERGRLDAARSGVNPEQSPGNALAQFAPSQQPGGPNAGATAAPYVAPPQPVELNGVVRRSSGRSTVWLNQVPQVDQNNTLLQRGHGAAALSLQLPSGRQVILQPGQSYDQNSGRVKDVHEQ